MITIIVLLLLAGVTIATLTGENGILSQAQNTKRATENATVEENIKLAFQSAKIRQYSGESEIFTTILQEELELIYGANSVDSILDNGDGTYTISLKGKIYTIAENGNVNKSGAQPLYGNVYIKLADESDLPTGGATEGSKLKIEFTVELPNGTVEGVTPETYNSTTKTVTHETTDAEVVAKEVVFTINCRYEGQTVTPAPIKAVDLSNYYEKVEKDTSDIKSSVSSFYGKEVTNYIDLDGNSNTNDWKIFYADETTDRIFLITSDYVQKSLLESKASNEGAVSAKDGASFDINGVYAAGWRSNVPTSQMSNISDNILNIFNATGYNLKNHTGNDNTRCVSTILNSNNWTYFIDAHYADYAIGSPTVEMWINSWNDMYTTESNITDKLYCNNTGDTGYYLGTNPKPTSFSIGSNVINQKTGYGNTLYFPHQSKIDNNLCTGYWIASPSAQAYNMMMKICYDGSISYDYNENYNSFRPLISLKPGTQLKKDSNGNYEIIENE